METGSGGPDTTDPELSRNNVSSTALNTMEIINNTEPNNLLKKRPSQSTPVELLSKKSNINQLRPQSNDTNSNIPVTKKSPYEINKNNRYNKSDSGPYLVIVEGTNSNNIGLLHKMSLGKIIFQKLKVESDNIVNIHNVGKNRIKIITKSSELANQILDSNLLYHYNLRAYIPESSIFRKGVVRNVDPTLSSEEILEVIESSINITDLRRITKKVPTDKNPKYINTPTVVLTFRGQILPDFISIYGARCAVRPYIYKVTQCLKCFRYGHIMNNCRSDFRCEKCKQTHPSSDCQVIPDQPFCLNCDGNHFTKDKNCPVYKEQYEIKKFMATNNVDFTEAKKKYKSYSRVVSQINNNSFPALANRFETLQEVVEPENTLLNNFNFSRPRTNRNLNHPRRQNLNNSIPKQHIVNTPSDAPASKGIINPYRPSPHAAYNQSRNSGNNDEQTRIILKSFLQFVKSANFSVDLENTDQLDEKAIDLYFSSLHHG